MTGERPPGSRSTRLYQRPANIGESTKVSKLTGRNVTRPSRVEAASSATPYPQPSGRRMLASMGMRRVNQPAG